ncbi:MAG: MFS transporter [Pseudomonadota bacterium]
MTDAIAIVDGDDDRAARRVVLILAWAQSILGAQLPVHFILGTLVGATLAESPAFATLPITMIVGGSMCAAPLMSALMARFGRRTGFLLAAGAGVLGAALAVHAIQEKSFGLFLAASALTGIYMAGQGFYRFAAADLASPRFRPTAISWVMAGGLVAALLGPQLVIEFSDYLEPIPYAGAYFVLVWLNLIGAIPLLFLEIPAPERRIRGQKPGRSYREILRDRKLVVAMLCAMVSYALMNLVMTSTPLAMVACGFGTGDVASVTRGHIVAMYAGSFITGPLIARIGTPRVICIGLTFLAIAGVVALSGIAFEHFAIALILLGLGWNFSFIGATTLLAESHGPEDRGRVQGLNDFLVFGMVTLASASSGVLISAWGWDAVNMAMLPGLTVAGLALIWLMRRMPTRQEA